MIIYLYLIIFGGSFSNQDSLVYHISFFERESKTVNYLTANNQNQVDSIVNNFSDGNWVININTELNPIDKNVDFFVDKDSESIYWKLMSIHLQKKPVVFYIEEGNWILLEKKADTLYSYASFAIKNQYLVGEFKFIAPNGEKTISTFEKGRLDGVLIVFDDKKEIKMVQYWKRGKHITSTVWYKNGVRYMSDKFKPIIWINNYRTVNKDENMPSVIYR